MPWRLVGLSPLLESRTDAPSLCVMFDGFSLRETRFLEGKSIKIFYWGKKSKFCVGSR
jgi:hypothetical protein